MRIDANNMTTVLPPHRISCSEIWGGIHNVDVDAYTGALAASIYSSAAGSGKGGDIYYLSVCDTDRLTRVAVADVVGHGLAVSAVSEWVYDVLALRMNDPAGQELLADLNRQITRRGLDAMTTAVIVGFYRDDSTLRVAYAGHPPLLIRRRGDRRWRVAGSSDQPDRPNLPLGVDEATAFDEDAFEVGPGDRLLAYTDGLIEAFDGEGNLFGQERLLAALDGAGDRDLPGLKHHVLEAVRKHTGGPLGHDDVTMLALEVM